MLCIDEEAVHASVIEHVCVMCVVQHLLNLCDIIDIIIFILTTIV